MRGNKPTKVKRYKNTYLAGAGGKRGNHLLGFVGVLIVCFAFGLVGYSLMQAWQKYVNGEIVFTRPPEDLVVTEISGDDIGGSSMPESSLPEEPEVPEAQMTRSGFFLTIEEVKNEATFLAKLEEAKAQDMDTIAFDIKDTSGNLHYQSTSQEVTVGGAVLPDAFSLADRIQKAKEAGLSVTVRMAVFEDNVASRVITESFIKFREDPAFRWIDNDANKGGRSWLNPEAATAQAYIKAIVTEVSAMGVNDIVLDRFHYPTGIGINLSYAGERSETDKIGVLSDFVKVLLEASGEANLILETTETDIVVGNELLYGGNPKDLPFSEWGVTLYTAGAPAGSESLEAALRDILPKVETGLEGKIVTYFISGTEEEKKLKKDIVKELEFSPFFLYDI